MIVASRRHLGQLAVACRLANTHLLVRDPCPSKTVVDIDFGVEQVLHDRLEVRLRHIVHHLPSAVFAFNNGDPGPSHRQGGETRRPDQRPSPPGCTLGHSWHPTSVRKHLLAYAWSASL